ncbi:MAG: ArsR family transcriptional regulator [Methanomicrobiales archaeon]|nr:ArsR family transcriptional regulator [Methanomicrobiales archaeon]
MKACIIFYSYSGITRGVARTIRDACGGDCIEVRPKEEYTALTAYTLGCLRARREEKDAIDPAVIDVTGYDLIVIGTPVWAWKAAPPVNAAIAALKGCEGKPAVLFATCGSIARDTLPILKKALAERKVMTVAEVVLTQADVGKPEAVNELVAAVKTALTP